MTSTTLGDLITVENQLSTLIWSREVHARLLASHGFVEEERHWVWYNHLQAAVLAVRRLLDLDRRSASLIGLLTTLQQAPEGTWPVAQLASDLQVLNELRSATESFANQYVAHMDRAGPRGPAPGFESIDAAIQAMRTVFLRWRALLTGNTSAELASEITWSTGAA